MSENSKKLFRVISEFILHIVVTISIIYVLFTWMDAIPSYNSNKVYDSVSIANTFMVFVTFIVVVATVAISIGAVFYTKQYSIAKERLLSENLDDVIKVLADKESIRKELIEKLLSDPSIRKNIDQRIEIFGSSINERIELFREEIKKCNEQNEELKKVILQEINALKIKLIEENVNEQASAEAIKKMFNEISEKGVADEQA